jgi:CheY-like chemotaxis protein
MARILIVDADKTFASILKDSLEKTSETQEYVSTWQLRITPVENTTQAKAVIDNDKFNFELVILDLQPARLDNWEFIRWLREKYKEFETPIVVTSSVEGIELEYAAIKNGASIWNSKSTPLDKFVKDMLKLIQER